MVTEVTDKADLKRAFVVCPPSAAASPWMRRFGDAQTAFASGWMQLRGARRARRLRPRLRRLGPRRLARLLQAIAATGAQRVIVTHGSTR
jgi:putative mRNA 3-end processing factor